MPDETNTTSRISTTGVEDVTVTEGTITFDIRFFAIAPKSGEHISLIINVEAQNNFYPGYPLIKRGLYYCSRMISSQYGTVFTKSHYEKIKKVYSIWICMNPPKGRENTITKYSITEGNYIGNVKEKIENYDLFTAIMICIGKPEQGDKESILRLLDVLLSPELIPDEKRNILKNDFSIPMTEYDRSDIVGIIQTQNADNFITKERIDKAVKELYGSWECLPEGAKSIIDKIYDDITNKELYSIIRNEEMTNKELLIDFENKYNNTLNEENLEGILKKISEHKQDEGKNSVLAKLHQNQKMIDSQNKRHMTEKIHEYYSRDNR